MTFCLTCDTLSDLVTNVRHRDRQTKENPPESLDKYWPGSGRAQFLTDRAVLCQAVEHYHDLLRQFPKYENRADDVHRARPLSLRFSETLAPGVGTPPRAQFGENVHITGLTAETLCVGDVFEVWRGDANRNHETAGGGGSLQESDESKQPQEAQDKASSGHTTHTESNDEPHPSHLEAVSRGALLISLKSHRIKEST